MRLVEPTRHLSETPQKIVQSSIAYLPLQQEGLLSSSWDSCDFSSAKLVLSRNWPGDLQLIDTKQKEATETTLEPHKCNARGCRHLLLKVRGRDSAGGNHHAYFKWSEWAILHLRLSLFHTAMVNPIQSIVWRRPDLCFLVPILYERAEDALKTGP